MWSQIGSMGLGIDGVDEMNFDTDRNLPHKKMRQTNDRNWSARVIEMIVTPQANSALFDDLSTRVRIDDEGGGEFITLTQYNGIDGEDTIRIEPDEWVFLRSVIDKLMNEELRNE